MLPFCEALVVCDGRQHPRRPIPEREAQAALPLAEVGELCEAQPRTVLTEVRPAARIRLPSSASVNATEAACSGNDW